MAPAQVPVLQGQNALAIWENASVATHRVRFRTRSCAIGWGDRIECPVSGNRVKLGELHVSQQGIKWVPRNKKTDRKMTWEQFDSLMSDAPGWNVRR